MLHSMVGTHPPDKRFEHTSYRFSPCETYSSTLFRVVSEGVEATRYSPRLTL